MITVYLLRHGQTTYNADGNRYCGRTDVDLTDLGVQQAQRMERLLDGISFDAVFTSPLKRAIRTAEIATSGTTAVQTDARLLEIDFGLWEGRQPNDFQMRDPDSWNSWLMDPLNSRAGSTGESGEEVLARLNDFYSELLVKYNHKRILIVGHNGVNRFFISSRLGMPLRNYRMLVQENSALTVLTLSEENGFNLLKLNS